MNHNGPTVGCVSLGIDQFLEPLLLLPSTGVFVLSNYSTHTDASTVGEKEDVGTFSSSSVPSIRQTRQLSLCSELEYSLMGHLTNKACCVIHCT